MNKQILVQLIIAQLSIDLEVLTTAAMTAHEASTHEENIPDNRYDTLALEASYIAQGQANRAREIRKSIGVYKQLKTDGVVNASVCMTSLVTLEDASGAQRTLFIGPSEGGLKIQHHGKEIVVITPISPLGRELLGRRAGDSVEIEAGSSRTEYEIVEVC